MTMRALWMLVCLGTLGMLAMAAKKPGDAEKGKVVFRQCSMCHRADATEAKMGPGLKGLFRRTKMQNGKKLSELTVRAQIDEGGKGMPPYREMLSEQEKEDLVAYLKTL